MANLGLLPTSSTAERPVPTYDAIFSYVAPLSIVWLLLKVNLRDLLKAGLPIITLFLIGSAGTTLGALAGMWIVNGPESIGPMYHALAGMFTGTYVGGSVNFNAVALHYNMMEEAVLFSGSVVVDNIVTTTWMVATLALPRLFAPALGKKSAGTEWNRVRYYWALRRIPNSMHPIDLSMMLFLGPGRLVDL